MTVAPRRLRLVSMVAFLVAITFALAPPGQRTAAQEIVVTVTSTADDPESEEHACPSDTLCTLRAAIDLANADESGEPVRIAFDPGVFPPDEPSPITVAALLPSITRANVTIDGRAAGVELLGTELGTSGTFGLHLAAQGGQVYGLTIRGFSGICLLLGGNASVAGSQAPGAENQVDDCATGIEVAGAGSTLAGNVVGLRAADPMLPVMATGVAITAANVVVGSTVAPGPINAIGNVATGILIGRGAEPAFSGVIVQANRIGASLDGDPAPVDVGVAIAHPSTASTVVENDFRNVGTAITIAPDGPASSSTGNALTRNTYMNLAGLAIDLGANGVLEPNDPGDLDSGPNGLLNSPEINTATQGLISGTACAGCTVSFYRADHVAGAQVDAPATPIPGLDVATDGFGQFSLVSPPVNPGEWLMAIVTDLAGNTSEFSMSFRVGAGLVQCGSSLLSPGWNLVGYFGESTLLGGTVPPAAVLAVHQLVDGSETVYSSWFSNGSAGLSTIQTGEAYWFYADESAQLPGGVSLSIGLPVQLVEGWNDFVYVGASAAVPDALASLDGQWDALYAFVNDGDGGAWRSYGDLSTPAYAHGFSDIQACSAYRIHMTAAATLVPLQP